MWDHEGRRKAEAISLGDHSGQTRKETNGYMPRGPQWPTFSSQSTSSSHSWLPALLTTSRPKFTTRHLTKPCPSDRFRRDSNFYMHFHKHLPWSFMSAIRHTKHLGFSWSSTSSQPVPQASLTRDHFSDTLTSPSRPSFPHGLSFSHKKKSPVLNSMSHAMLRIFAFFQEADSKMRIMFKYFIWEEMPDSLTRAIKAGRGSNK